ncbi:hypothetical protein EJB05_30235, partial [Eragrostis curvula]
MVGMTGGGGGACAVCKHQRRKCEPNCELAAYFPANRMNDFRALHLVFGVANLTKLIKANATDAARRRAAETLTWEARWRERDPAEGCYREVACLRRDNALLRAENAALRKHHFAGNVMPPPPTNFYTLGGNGRGANANGAAQTMFVSYTQDRGAVPLCPPPANGSDAAITIRGDKGNTR